MTKLVYRSGRPGRLHDVGKVLESLAERLLEDGDIDRALQLAFRLGTEDDIGLLDILDRLREEAASDPAESPLDPGSESGAKPADEAAAMREALRQIESLNDLQGLDPDMMERALTLEEREWIDVWANMTGRLIDSGLAVQQGTRLHLTPKAIRRIGANLLRNMYLPPTHRGRGSHTFPQRGSVGSPGDEISPWSWGLPFDLDVTATVFNAVNRGGQHRPLHLDIDDFAVRDRESAASYTTVLLLDLSRSMFESGAWNVARRAAIALDALAESTHHQDHLHLVGFSGTARELKLVELPRLSWDQFSHGTNLHHGLIVARRLLERVHRSNRQIVIISDGDPTAYMDGVDPVFENPVTDATLKPTLLEARRIARAGIRTTIVRIGEDDALGRFAHQLAHTVNGRLIHMPLERLGVFVVRDIGTGKSRMVR